MLLDAAKCKGCSFYHFWVIKAKPKLGLRKQILNVEKTVHRKISYLLYFLFSLAPYFKQR